MFAFIDESGHTGSAIDDQQQPTYNTLAIFSKRNLDVQHKLNIEKLCAELGVKELHFLPSHSASGKAALKPSGRSASSFRQQSEESLN